MRYLKVVSVQILPCSEAVRVGLGRPFMAVLEDGSNWCGYGGTRDSPIPKVGDTRLVSA